MRYCKSTIFQANHNGNNNFCDIFGLFAILQKYDFSSKSQRTSFTSSVSACCLRYCKSTIFQANHNKKDIQNFLKRVVCDTAKVRFFKQITTEVTCLEFLSVLFAILQKYDFSSKSQRRFRRFPECTGCLRYCKSTIFQANHNERQIVDICRYVVCDTAKVRFFKQITTKGWYKSPSALLFAILQKYDFSSKSQLVQARERAENGCLRYCKSTIFQANHNSCWRVAHIRALFAILQKYDFSSKSQPIPVWRCKSYSCLRYCKSTIFQANHN